MGLHNEYKANFGADTSSTRLRVSSNGDERRERGGSIYTRFPSSKPSHSRGFKVVLFEPFEKVTSRPRT